MTIFDTVNEHEAELQRLRNAVRRLDGGQKETAAVIDGLKAGHLSGVALDVYEEEEGVFFEDLSGAVLQDDELARLLMFPNVLVTAHQAFLTREALGEIARITVGNLRGGATGGFLPGTVVE